MSSYNSGFVTARLALLGIAGLTRVTFVTASTTNQSVSATVGAGKKWTVYAMGLTCTAAATNLGIEYEGTAIDWGYSTTTTPINTWKDLSNFPLELAATETIGTSASSAAVGRILTLWYKEESV